MTGKRPRLYPSHQHEWTDADVADPMQQNRQIVSCTVCGFTVPRNLANLDGKPAEPKPGYADADEQARVADQLAAASEELTGDIPWSDTEQGVRAPLRAVPPLPAEQVPVTDQGVAT